MAASYIISNTPLSNRYNGNTANEDEFPAGGCNWTNLSLGLNAPRCGCKRFWDKGTTQSLSSNGRGDGKTGFCMCEHHACYHDLKNDGGSRLVETTSATPRPESTPQVLKTAGTAEDNQVGTLLRDSAMPDTMQWSRYIHGSSQGLPAIPSQCLLPSENGSMTSGSQSAYTRPFGGLGLGTLDHIPRTRNATNKLPLADKSRLHVYEDAHGRAYLQSITDAATPSIRSSQPPDLDVSRHVASVHNALETVVESQVSQSATISRRIIQECKYQAVVERSASDQDNEPKDSKQLLPHRHAVPNDASHRLANHEQRLDLLENASFSNAPIEELQDAHEHMDTRVGELEVRVGEIEKAQAAQDSSSVGSRQLAGESFDSRVSNTSSTMDRIDPSRVDVLEAQIAELQAVAAPTRARPWELEIVFVPFGTSLSGIWSSHNAGTQRSKQDSDTWTQTPHNSVSFAQADLDAHDQNAAWEHCATGAEDNEKQWLTARACGHRSRIDERLRSRGLVKTVQICGPDARDVQAAMLTAFGDLLGTIAKDPFNSQDENNGTIPRTLDNYIGLRAAWIPLRKVHKDSCLRFLNPAEMVTPALWTVPFLSSSVAMRQSGNRRLYVTQRDSYIQHLSSSSVDWTWQKLRQLPRVYPDQPSLSHTPEADAQESCWAWDARLDPAPESIHSSFASHISSLSIQSLPGSPEDLQPASPSDHFSSAAVSTTSTPRTSIAPPLPLSPLKERNPFRPLHTRTTSMPSFIPLKDSGSSSQLYNTSKRRIASYEQETRSSPPRMPSTSAQNLRSLDYKRRRISRSPSRPQDTPRWSIGPPSPYPFAEDPERKRGNTPFAYATPHSNAPYVPRSNIDVYEDEEDDGHNSTTDDFDADGEGYDQNALSDYEYNSHDGDEVEQGPPQGHMDEEWEGVHDEAVHDSRLAGKADIILRHFSYPSVADHEDAKSDASSQPSEYPSTQQPEDIPASHTLIGKIRLFEGRQKKEKKDLEFRIHVDQEVEGTGLGQA